MKTAVQQYETCFERRKIYESTAVQQRAVHFAPTSTCCGPFRLFAPPPCGLSSSCFLIFSASFLICLTVLSEMPNFSATALGFTFLPKCSRTSIFVLRIKFNAFGLQQTSWKAHRRYRIGAGCRAGIGRAERCSPRSMRSPLPFACWLLCRR